MTNDNAEALLQAGDAALDTGDWQAARTSFRSALEIEETPRALEGLGRATWWLDELDVTFPSRERAFQLYRQQGDPKSAARVAMSLCLDYADALGEFAVSQGWLQRAESLLEDLGVTQELAWLRGYQGAFAIESPDNLPAARDLLAQARTMARALAIFDLEMLTNALEGYALVREGKVREGMQLMDESMTAAIAGEVHDLSAAGQACCTLIYACESIADYDRASQWATKARDFCGRWGLKSFFSMCRVYYCGVLMLRGDWQEADRELAEVTDHLVRTRPAAGQEAIARLGELRRRQGRIEEAEALFAKAESHNQALLGRARIAIDGGDPVGAGDLIDRLLRHLTELDRAERAAAFFVLLQARLALADTAGATEALDEIEVLAKLTGTLPLRALSALGRGALADALDDPEGARRGFEDAVDLYQRTLAPFEAALARRDLALVLRKLGRIGNARKEARLAFEALRRLGARREMDRALDLLRSLEDAPSTQAAGDIPGLSRRESEVVALIARGLSNQEIAAELVLSVRTVERHISSIYEKLGLHGGSARAAAAAYALGRGAG